MSEDLLPPAPDLQQWQTTSKKVDMGDKKLVTEDSMIQYTKGGTITVKDHTQKAGGSGAPNLINGSTGHYYV